MAQIIQLSVEDAPRFTHDGRRIYYEDERMAYIEPSRKAGRKDPCKKCWAKGLCDDGECARKLFPLFVD